MRRARCVRSCEGRRSGAREGVCGRACVTVRGGGGGGRRRLRCAVDGSRGARGTAGRSAGNGAPPGPHLSDCQPGPGSGAYPWRPISLARGTAGRGLETRDACPIAACRRHSPRARNGVLQTPGAHQGKIGYNSFHRSNGRRHVWPALCAKCRPAGSTNGTGIKGSPPMNCSSEWRAISRATHNGRRRSYLFGFATRPSIQ